jgi:hypothetical protein
MEYKLNYFSLLSTIDNQLRFEVWLRNQDSNIHEVKYYIHNDEIEVVVSTNVSLFLLRVAKKRPTTICFYTIFDYTNYIEDFIISLSRQYKIEQLKDM